ncbi:Pvc16 family protein [Acidobacterium sp. S8]|uniref:Pvc16 family protein n=1 Tax=Acidobacterium sp. S8 TaxID=1641854 RepID=UPI00131BB18D|nr:Pvc16 family protein [Acidobacterium sp. S8]
MVAQPDKLLMDWTAHVHSEIPVSLAPPSAKVSGRGIGLYLLELLHMPPPSTTKRPPLQLSLRYLVTAWSDSPEDAHQILIDLAFAALSSTDPQMEMEAVPLTVWTALCVPPMPAFILRVPLRQERPEADVKIVRQPVQIATSTMIQLHGVVLGPEDIPLADSRVEIPAMKLKANANHKGRFFFPAVPAEGPKILRVRARGRELSVRCEKSFPDQNDPLVIHFSPLES